MKVEEALNNISAPKGLTSIIEGIMAGNFDPIREQSSDGKTLDEARNELLKAQQAQNECKSDWAYWGYMGDISYWKAVVNILEAAALVGNDNLPDVPKPQDGLVVMDSCAAIENYGAQILKLAKQAA